MAGDFDVADHQSWVAAAFVADVAGGSSVLEDHSSGVVGHRHCTWDGIWTVVVGAKDREIEAAERWHPPEAVCADSLADWDHVRSPWVDIDLRNADWTYRRCLGTGWTGIGTRSGSCSVADRLGRERWGHYDFRRVGFGCENVRRWTTVRFCWKHLHENVRFKIK